MDTVAAACEVTEVTETDGATYQSSTSTSSGAGGTSLTPPVISSSASEQSVDSESLTSSMSVENIMPKFPLNLELNGEKVRN